MLTDIYGVNAASVGLYLLPFAVGNFCGPLFLGRLFDTWGRKPMIAGTYIISGLLLIVTGILFQNGTLTATTQTIAGVIIFFFASAGASAAYLTVSEIFPMETRAMAIAFFYATGTIVGGFGGPLLFGALIESGSRDNIFIGYLVGAIVMIFGGVVQALMGVEAAGRDLEDIAPPLSAAGEEQPEPGEEADRTRTGATRARAARWPTTATWCTGAGSSPTGPPGRAWAPAQNRGGPAPWEMTDEHDDEPLAPAARAQQLLLRAVRGVLRRPGRERVLARAGDLHPAARARGPGGDAPP